MSHSLRFYQKTSSHVPLITNQSNVPLSSSQVHNSSQEVPQVTGKSMALSLPAMMDIDGPELSRKSPGRKQSATKRKAVEQDSDENAEGLNLRRSKRVKVSVPQKNVDLDW